MLTRDLTVTIEFQTPRRGVINQEVARLMTERNWRRYQRCERLRQWVIRWSILLLFSLCALCVLLFK